MNIRYLFFGSLLCGGFFSLYAQTGDTITWKSTEPKSEGDWSDPTQWDLGRVPEDGDTVVLSAPTGRSCFTTRDCFAFTPDELPAPSGLLGPVRLLIGEERR